VFPSGLPGVNPATLNRMLLYYRLMTKQSGLGDSTELSRVGLSQDRLKIANKKRQRMKSEVCGKQNYKDDQSFSYKLFGTVKCSNTLQLH
jgi:hypothetical protein